MSLWQSTDANTSAPKFMTFSGLGVSANGFTLYGNTQVGAFKSNVALGVDGITPAEKANTPGPQHAGWVNRKNGTGPISSISITAEGKGYTNGFVTIANGGLANTAANASYEVRANGSVITAAIVNGGAGYSNGFVTITNGGTGNSAANISFTVNGAGGIVSTTINNGGSNYNTPPTLTVLGANTVAASLTADINSGAIIGVTVVTPGSYANTPNVTVANANIQATFSVTMGGRANRVQYETLVAGGSIV